MARQLPDMMLGTNPNPPGGIDITGRGPIQLTDQQLTQLAMEYDPAPVLMAFSSMPSGNFLTMPQPSGVTPGQGMSFEDIVQGTPTQQQPAAPRQAAPLDQRALGLLAAMNPSQQPRAPAAGLVQPRPVQLGPVATSQRAVPASLAQILGR